MPRSFFPLVALALALGLATPARAADGLAPRDVSDAAGLARPAATPRAERSPWIAAGLTLAPAADFYIATMITHTQLANAALPALLGAGEWYAGDPWRALAVSAGGYGAIGLGAAAGLGASFLLPGGQAETLGDILDGGVVGLALYAGLATFDAYRTAERENARALP